MPDFIQVPIDGGEAFLLEVDRRTVRVARGDEPVEVAQESFQRSLDRVRVIATQVVDKLSTLSRQPERVRVEFGVKLAAEAGVIVARTAGEAHFVVELEWTRGSDGPRKPADG
jgi:Trypsin-co-occurring domain 1